MVLFMFELYLFGEAASGFRPLCGILFVVPSFVAPKFWRGPVLGRSVSFISPSHTSALFLEFGKLTNHEGVQGYPNGEYVLSSFATFPAWTLRGNGGVLSASTDRQTVRDRALRRLIGRRLKTVAIDEASSATRLTFSLGLVLETETTCPGRRGKPHWLLKSVEQPLDWVIVSGRYPQPKSPAEWRRLIHPS